MTTPSVTTHYDLDRVRYVTAHFFELQGLRILPFGVWLMLVGAGELGLVPLDWPMRVAISGVLLCAAWLASRRIGQHYDRRFGRVEAKSPGVTRRGVASAGLGGLAGFLDSHLDPTVSLPALLMSAVLLREWYRGVRGQRTHYAATALLCLALGVSPLFSWGPTPRVSYPVLIAASGWLLVVLGIGNHALLVAVLRPLPADDHDRPV